MTKTGEYKCSLQKINLTVQFGNSTKCHIPATFYNRPSSIYKFSSPGQMDSQVDASRHKNQNFILTWDGWRNRFTSWLTSSRMSQKVVNFTLVQLTCNKLAFWALPKSMQVNASGYQMKRKSKTCIDLRVRLARAKYKQISLQSCLHALCLTLWPWGYICKWHLIAYKMSDASNQCLCWGYSLYSTCSAIMLQRKLLKWHQ